MTGERGPAPRPGGRLRPDTLAVRGGLRRSTFDETAEALFLTQGYVYDSAGEAEAAFKGEIERFVYSRYGNPTVSMFEERLRLLEGAQACFATATGMAAVFNSLAAILKTGDRVVAARALFGSCFVILDEILPRWGVETDFVDGDDLDQWRAALSSPTQAVFFESPSNPMQELVDIAAVCELAHAAGAQVVVDNVFATPCCSRPMELGADIVVYSATKHIDGPGPGARRGDPRAEGVHRRAGAEPDAAHRAVAEPVQRLGAAEGPGDAPAAGRPPVRGRAADRAVAGGGRPGRRRALPAPAQPPAVRPGQAADVGRRHGGHLRPRRRRGKERRFFALLDKLRVIDISNNLGDAKSLVTHPATTTHRRLTPEARAAAGITDGIVRVSVGLEDVDDLVGDLDQALLPDSTSWGSPPGRLHCFARGGAVQRMRKRVPSSAVRHDRADPTQPGRTTCRDAGRGQLPAAMPVAVELPAAMPVAVARGAN